MAKSSTVTVRKLPWWAPVFGSAAILFHLLAVAVFALAAPSGPWPAPYGQDLSPGPQFADTGNNLLYPVYLRPLGLAHHYHFATDQPAAYGVKFEIVLRDERGWEIERLTFPQRDVNFWVRHRQQMLAQALAMDVPTQVRGTEKVAPKGGNVPKQDYWLTRLEVDALVHPKDPVSGKLLRDEKGEPLKPLVDPRFLQLFPSQTSPKTEYVVRVLVEEDRAGNIPRTQRQILRPAPWTVILAKSYMRYLCQKHGAHSAELIRYSRPAVLPVAMFYAELPPPLENVFVETIAHYGDLKQDFDEVPK
jgi:hypothetical protein